MSRTEEFSRVYSTFTGSQHRHSMWHAFETKQTLGNKFTQHDWYGPRGGSSMTREISISFLFSLFSVRHTLVSPCAREQEINKRMHYACLGPRLKRAIIRLFYALTANGLQIILLTTCRYSFAERQVVLGRGTELYNGRQHEDDTKKRQGRPDVPCCRTYRKHQPTCSV